MRLTKILLILAITFYTFSACQKTNTEDVINGKVLNQGDCKDFKIMRSTLEVADTLSCIVYNFLPSESKLLLTHQNTGFNCCPGELTCTISQNNDTIFIQEFEELAACDCNCLFDIHIEISGIETKVYYLKFIEPYCGDQEKLQFEINLSENTEGVHCVSRYDYPWGIYSFR